jgi:uncharacterized membrane protein YdjX (TVP38/TMEM64 family)
MRVIWIFLGFAIAVAGSWWIWGSHYEAIFTFEETVDWLRSHPSVGGLAGCGLLISDLLLPVPGTVVMSALGYVYGWMTGGLLASAGSMGAGIAGYLAGRLLPEKWARRWIGEADYDKSRSYFSEGAGWIIAASRALPILPEALSCTAGMVRMPMRRFALSLACGSLPTGFLFAVIGAQGISSPGWTMALSLLVPALLWAIARPYTRTRVP